MYWNGRSSLASPADGQVTLTNAAGTDFNLLLFGGNTSSFPSIKRSGAGLVVRLADDSGNAGLTASNLTSTGDVVTAANSSMQFLGRSILASAVNGNMRISNNAGSDFGLLQFGGTTSSFPSIQRSGTGLIVRLADDSANAPITASNVISTATVRLKGYTVATLPTGVQGDMAFVTDALVPVWGATVVGGGAVVTKVFYNGTNWICD